MAHSWAWDSKVNINSKQMGAGIEETVLSFCCGFAAFGEQRYFAATLSFLVSERL